MDLTPDRVIKIQARLMEFAEAWPSWLQTDAVW
jgi:hypothetical protein